MPRLPFASEPAPEAVAAARMYADDLLLLPNVFGVGAAQKVVNGQRTDTIGVVVYVTNKQSPASLATLDRIPRELTVGGDRVVTDVVQAVRPRPCDVSDGKVRPLVGGCQIGASTGMGTAGGVFYDRRYPYAPVLLTNNHVLTDPNAPYTLPISTVVTQPAGGERIGFIQRIVPWWPAPFGAPYAFEYVVDAGIVGYLDGIKTKPSILDIAGRHPFLALPPYRNLKVVRRGFRTQLKAGTVECTGLTLDWYSNHADKAFRAGVGGTLFAIRSDPGEVTAMPGDSGSLVVDDAGAATRGLVCLTDGQDGGITYACDILDVMKEMEIDTACNGGIRRLVIFSILKRFPTLSMADRERLIYENFRKFSGFRADYLSPNGEGTLSGVLGALLEGEPGQAIAESMLTDDEFAGLLPRAIGTWLIEPTVFDMLEYVLPDHFVPDLLAAFTRLGCVQPGAIDTSWLADAFRDGEGRSMREVLDRKVKAPEPAGPAGRHA